MPRINYKKMAALPDFKNTFDRHTAPLKSWNKDYFCNTNPIILELGCGHGHYTVEMARMFPDKNFIGIDIKGSRIWEGAQLALEENLPNVGFLRIRIEFIEEFFSTNDIDEIWITFPDPYPKRSCENRRLTAPVFLKKYHKFLKPAGNIHLKTDDPGLFTYTQKIITEQRCTSVSQIENIHKPPTEDPLLQIQTTYEKRYINEGKTISYLRFILPAAY